MVQGFFFAHRMNLGANNDGKALRTEGGRLNEFSG